MAQEDSTQVIDYQGAGTPSPKPSTTARRLWDVVVGVFMVATGGLFTFILAALFAMALVPVFPEKWMSRTWFSAMVVVALFVILTSAAFYDFHRKRRYSGLPRSAGRVHMIPRGVHRIRFGRDTLE